MTLPSIVFFGTTDFSVHVLKELHQKGFPLLAIVTKPDEPSGRGRQLTSPPVKEWAQNHLPGLPLLQPERASEPAVTEEIASFGADLFVVVAFGEILKPNLLAVPKMLPLNIHASLLPKYRGASPIRHAILAGEKETGISIIAMSPQLDAGGVIAVRKIDILPTDDFGSVEKKLRGVSVPALIEAIEKLSEGRAEPAPQEASLVTQAPKLRKEDCILDFSKTAEQLDLQIRSLSPEPGAYATLFLKGDSPKRFKIFKADVAADQNFEGDAGSFHLVGKECWIKTGKGALSLKKVQLEGKKEVDIDLFLRGYAQAILHLK